MKKDTTEDKQVNSDPSKSRPKSNIRQIKYAEIVSGKGIVLPIKIMLNEHIASSAVDSLRDSKLIADELAKEWIMKTLSDKKNIIRFGFILQDLFSYEPVLSPTRWLINWTIAQKSTENLAFFQLKWHLNDFTIGPNSTFSKHAIVSSSASLLQSKSFCSSQAVPLLTWALGEYNISVANLIDLTAWSIPFAKESAVQGIKLIVNESLKSPETKKFVKETLIQYIQRMHGNRTGNEERKKIP